ncbi:MAG: hypothetical protein Q7S92_02715 [Candidatus Diapherotrites archaeon]|nr:hypothetical protein [Candidatus Diapherotrites archaeon]
MLREDKFAILAIAVSLLGLILLFYYTETQQPILVKVSEITEEKIGWQIETQGRVKNLYSGKNFLAFELIDQNSISGILFNPNTIQAAVLQENFKVKIQGKIEKRNKQLQIQVQEVSSFD